MQCGRDRRPASTPGPERGAILCETWREQGDAGLDFYTIERTVYDNF